MKHLLDSETAFIAGIFTLILAFSGEPDLMDAIIHWIMKP